MSQRWLDFVKWRSLFDNVAAGSTSTVTAKPFRLLIFAQGDASSRIRPLLCNRGDTAIINIGLSVICLPKLCRGCEEAQLI